MRSSPPPERSRGRRRVLWVGAALGCGLAVPHALLAAEAAPAALAALHEGGVAVMLRHAQAPGTFDPPEFRLGDCRTQRNLDDAGRAQARRIGAWFRSHALQPAAVRSSPWCRCLDTARLAFGDATVQPWAALGSVRMAADREVQAAELKRALAAVPPGRFEVWVSHQFTMSALGVGGAASGEGVVLRAAAGAAADAPPQIVGTLAPA